MDHKNNLQGALALCLQAGFAAGPVPRLTRGQTPGTRLGRLLVRDRKLAGLYREKEQALAAWTAAVSQDGRESPMAEIAEETARAAVARFEAHFSDLLAEERQEQEACAPVCAASEAAEKHAAPAFNTLQDNRKNKKAEEEAEMSALTAFLLGMIVGLAIQRQFRRNRLGRLGRMPGPAPSPA